MHAQQVSLPTGHAGQQRLKRKRSTMAPNIDNELEQNLLVLYHPLSSTLYLLVVRVPMKTCSVSRVLCEDVGGRVNVLTIL